MKEVGPLIAKILRHRGLEQKALAQGIGISEQTVGVILKYGADRWKLSYFDEACKFLHVSPKTFFDNWGDDGNVINGNVENNAIMGTSNFSMVSGNENPSIEKELRERLADKDAQITALNKIIELQKILLKQYGAPQELQDIDGR